MRLVQSDVLPRHICPRKAGRGGAAAAPSAPFRRPGSRKPLPQRHHTMTSQGTAHLRDEPGAASLVLTAVLLAAAAKAALAGPASSSPALPFRRDFRKRARQDASFHAHLGLFSLGRGELAVIRLPPASSSNRRLSATCGSD